MVLSGLKNLYKSMKGQELDRVRFQYKHARVIFDVFFFIDETPFCLLFGAKEFNFAFEMPVRAGFAVEPILSSGDYKALCAALGLEYDPLHPFSVKVFLERFNESIPSEIGPGTIRPEQIAVYRRDVEEAEKIYFFQWRDNTVLGKHVTPENLEKTKRLLGKQAYEACRRRNISSCWTDDHKKRRVPPPIDGVDALSTVE